MILLTFILEFSKFLWPFYIFFGFLAFAFWGHRLKNRKRGKKMARNNPMVQKVVALCKDPGIEMLRCKHTEVLFYDKADYRELTAGSGGTTHVNRLTAQHESESGSILSGSIARHFERNADHLVKTLNFEAEGYQKQDINAYEAFYFALKKALGSAWTPVKVEYSAWYREDDHATDYGSGGYYDSGTGRITAAHDVEKAPGRNTGGSVTFYSFIRSDLIPSLKAEQKAINDQKERELAARRQPKGKAWD